MKNLIFKGFLIAHLCTVLLGSGLIKITNKSFEAALCRYTLWTGGGFGYSFFSPNVGNQTVIKTYTLTARQQLKIDAFGTGRNMFDSRFSSAIHTFRNQKAYELMSRVVVSYISTKYPHQGPVFISVGEYKPESMEQYRAGTKSGKFYEVYNGTYTYN
ncbi:hypothetical protein SAMN06265348_104148 [Pedobacter westerhofensis]|uniref:Uncharacterized protein n=1 Tax=Pedobacter westerhofensis TaxID=425512 RepID=A0A521CR65_9SPHI|nr:hypothetical protein [Pedobacter westerhofensis]SMO61969.1 hypothetical protein SAMN06265348_104148 [Pedobacter westerhofensis]